MAKKRTLTEIEMEYNSFKIGYNQEQYRATLLYQANNSANKLDKKHDTFLG